MAKNKMSLPMLLMGAAMAVGGCGSDEEDASVNDQTVTMGVEESATDWQEVYSEASHRVNMTMSQYDADLEKELKTQDSTVNHALDFLTNDQRIGGDPVKFYVMKGSALRVKFLFGLGDGGQVFRYSPGSDNMVGEYVIMPPSSDFYYSSIPLTFKLE